MSGYWPLLLWLAASFLALFYLRRWIIGRVQTIGYLLSGDPAVTMWIYFAVFLPGVVVHELGHWLMALLLGVPRGGIKIWPERTRGGMRLGSVKIKSVDPLRNSLIGLAPLLGGSLVVLLVGDWVLGLGELGQAILAGRWEVLWRLTMFYLSIPDVWLWLYLIFTVATSMMPSESDREAWPPVIIFLAVVVLAALVSGWSPQIGPEVAEGVHSAIGALAYAFTLAAGVDLLFGVALFSIAQLLIIWHLGTGDTLR
jgi:hypothetical protein